MWLKVSLKLHSNLLTLLRRHQEAHLDGLKRRHFRLMLLQGLMKLRLNLLKFQPKYQEQGSVNFEQQLHLLWLELRFAEKGLILYYQRRLKVLAYQGI